VKGYTGHALAAAGAIEAVVSVLTILHQTVPPTTGTASIDDEVNLPVVLGSGLAHPIDYVLSNSFGFGGHNGCLIFGRP
jgi:3-oxoacyl-[acyl-carrier-protein] synthase II